MVFSYGLKTVHGVNRLSGPGLEAKDFPGMMQGGGKWPGRLVVLSCFMYLSSLLSSFFKTIAKYISFFWYILSRSL